jgi:hypothetical protein
VNASDNIDCNQNFHTISNDLIVKPVFSPSIGISSMDNIHPHLRGVLELIERDIGKSKLEERLLKYSSGNRSKDSKNSSPSELSNLVTFDLRVNDHSKGTISPVSPTKRSRYTYDPKSPVRMPITPEKDAGPKFIQFRDIMNATTVEDQKEKCNDPKDFVKVVKADEQVIKSKVQRHSCPKCQGNIICLKKGKGWTHTGSAKHSKSKNVKCKFCTNCSGCDGTGLVSGKIACINCETRGFFHPSTAREHDLPPHLLCFYCLPCMDCRGSGLVDSKIVKPLQLLTVNF